MTDLRVSLVAPQFRDTRDELKKAHDLEVVLVEELLKASWPSFDEGGEKFGSFGTEFDYLMRREYAELIVESKSIGLQSEFIELLRSSGVE
ncbi:hypothetical protein [Cognatishimia sp. F0-27]|uniref:hypothetical protein n=1 Tax=Cognatishimia sp. F0-27 TaxID=2816855 RepID=UPI001D0BFB20|nr:hypothetical protein [Cognatishimia sp. F0-27]MCC1494289.1 hypothetical protein [Cognatishimia sp. F0-27]